MYGRQLAIHSVAGQTNALGEPAQGSTASLLINQQVTSSPLLISVIPSPLICYLILCLLCNTSLLESLCFITPTRPLTMTHSITSQVYNSCVTLKITTTAGYMLSKQPTILITLMLPYSSIVIVSVSLEDYNLLYFYYSYLLSIL